MRRFHELAGVLTAAIVLAFTAPALAQDADRKVAGGGISVAGWEGQIDPAAAKKGMSINDSKFVAEGNDLHLAVGPAAIYWNPSNTAKGDYAVSATFKEGKASAGHPHPYGLFIGGNKMKTDEQSFVYCVAYSDGTYLVRQFNGANVTTLAKRAPHAAVNKAGAEGGVTQEVGWTVKGGRAECTINGQSVASFNAADIVGAGKLESLDGVYGIRVSHNVDVVVSGLAKK